MKNSIYIIVIVSFIICSAYLQADEAATPPAGEDGGLPPVQLFFLIASAIALFVLAVGAFFGGQLFVSAVWKGKLNRELKVLDEYHGRALVWGLAGTVLVLLLFFTIANLGPAGELIALLILSTFCLICVAGSAAVCIYFGNKMKLTGILDPTEISPASLARGLAGISLGSMFPVIGWFLLFPYAAALSFGCFLQSMRMPGAEEDSSQKVEDRE